MKSLALAAAYKKKISARTKKDVERKRKKENRR